MRSSSGRRGRQCASRPSGSASPFRRACRLRPVLRGFLDAGTALFGAPFLEVWLRGRATALICYLSDRPVAPDLTGRCRPESYHSSNGEAKCAHSVAGRGRPLCANTGHSPAALRTRHIRPLAAFRLVSARDESATTGPSREKLRPRQLDAAHDIRLERFSGRCRWIVFSNGSRGSALDPLENEIHGMRSALRDWMGDVGNIERDVAEACLAHVVGGVEGAYRRNGLLMVQVLPRAEVPRAFGLTQPTSSTTRRSPP